MELPIHYIHTILVKFLPRPAKNQLGAEIEESVSQLLWLHPDLRTWGPIRAPPSTANG